MAEWLVYLFAVVFLYVLFLRALTLFTKPGEQPSTDQTVNDEPAFPVKGDIIYADKGRYSKSFQSKEYRIKAKPDFLVRDENSELCLVEYKSRFGGVKDSDVAQVIASAIAVKDEHPDLKHGIIYTKTKTKYVSLSDSQAELANQIQTEITAARAVSEGCSVEASPSPGKCRSCSYRMSCIDSLTA